MADRFAPADPNTVIPSAVEEPAEGISRRRGVLIPNRIRALPPIPLAIIAIHPGNAPKRPQTGPTQ
jgi:hypothetical protein